MPHSTQHSLRAKSCRATSIFLASGAASSTMTPSRHGQTSNGLTARCHSLVKRFGPPTASACDWSPARGAHISHVVEIPPQAPHRWRLRWATERESTVPTFTAELRLRKKHAEQINHVPQRRRQDSERPLHGLGAHPQQYPPGSGAQDGR
eukprot:5067772-Pyramimonas_sp.AAC.1